MSIRSKQRSCPMLAHHCFSTWKHVSKSETSTDLLAAYASYCNTQKLKEKLGQFSEVLLKHNDSEAESWPAKLLMGKKSDVCQLKTETASSSTSSSSVSQVEHRYKTIMKYKIKSGFLSLYVKHLIYKNHLLKRKTLKILNLKINKTLCIINKWLTDWFLST